MTTNGTAVQLGSCNCYQLTPPSLNQAGAIWSPQTIDMTQPWDMTFDVYLGSFSTFGADGMGFVLQENPNGLGSLGAGLGFGMPYSFPAISNNNLAIELDIFDNGGSVPSDLVDDHIAINSNGGYQHDLAGPTVFPGAQIVDDGSYHEFRVTWDPGIPALAVYWEGSAIPIIGLNQDIPTTIFGGNTNLYWGFTGGTGGVSTETRVCVTSTASFTTDLTTVCPGIPIQFTDGSTSPLGSPNGWSWDFGDGTSPNTTQSPSYSYNGPGTFTAELTMTDAFGCDYTDNTVITILDSISLNMGVTSVSCFGDLDGTATGTPTTGASPYGWSWNDTGTQNTETATSLPPGTYTVTVTDNLGCVGIDSVEVIEPLEIMLLMDSLNVVCNGDSTGEAIVNVTNGVPPLAYLWDDYMAQTVDTANTLPAGTYSVTVTDSDGCTAMGSVSITENAAINLSATVTPDNGTNNGTIDLTATGGSGPLTFLWDSSETTEDLSGVASGPHTVTVTDSLGCSEVLVVNVTSSIGFQSLSDIGFNFFPNPNDGNFTVQGVGEYQIIIRDLRGRVVLSETASEVTYIQIEDVQSGVYLMTIVKDRAEYIEKLIVK